MLTEKQWRRQQQVRQLYIAFLGWVWIAAGFATLYFLFAKFFLGGSWSWFLGSSLIAYVFYQVTLFYKLEQDAATRAGNPQMRPRHLKPSTYQVFYSDGVVLETRLTPEEIHRWAMATNEDAMSKYAPITQIEDEAGTVVWSFEGAPKGR